MPFILDNFSSGPQKHPTTKNSFFHKFRLLVLKYNLNKSNEQKPFRRSLHDLECTFFFIHGYFNKSY